MVFKFVQSYSWSRRSFLKNVLLTSCKDNIGRIWSETNSEEGFFFFTTGACTIYMPSVLSSLHIRRHQFDRVQHQHSRIVCFGAPLD